MPMSKNSSTNIQWWYSDVTLTAFIVQCIADSYLEYVKDGPNFQDYMELLLFSVWVKRDY